MALRSHLWALTTAFVLTTTSPAHAAVEDALENIEDASEDPLGFGAGIRQSRKMPPIRLKLEEDIDWNEFKGTDVTMFRSKFSARLILPFSKRFVLSVSSSASMTNTAFHGDDDFIDTGRASGDAWDELYGFSIRLRSRYAIDDQWGLVVSGWTTSRFEQGGTFDDGMKGAGAFGVTYRYGKRLSLMAGVAVSSRIVGNSASVYPIAQISWKIDEVHDLSTSGLGLRLRSRWNKTITTYAFGRLSGRRWRLDDRKDGEVNKGSLRDQKAPIGVGVQWKFWKDWRLRGDFGVLVYRELKVTDRDGDTVATQGGDAPGVFGSLVLQRRF